MPGKLPVGIIGFGAFGRFMVEQLSPYVPVLVTSRSAEAADVAATGAKLVSFEEVAQCHMVIPSVPVQNLEAVLERLAPKLAHGSLVMDVSSVKTVPVEIMTRVLPGHCEILATHPLFGPQSGANGIAGLPMAVWPVRIGDNHFQKVKDFLVGTLKLEISEVSPEEHDREMAYVHALTFFLGRTFSDLNIPDTPLKTRTYQHLLDVKRIVEGDTPELFETIQRFNPYAREVREQFVGKLSSIEAGLESEYTRKQ